MMNEKKQNNNSGNQSTSVAVRCEIQNSSSWLMESDVDLQVRTAKAFFRSIGQAKQRAIESATLDQETAAMAWWFMREEKIRAIGCGA